MIKTFFVFTFFLFAVTAFSQNKKASQIDSSKQLVTVDASCGQCKFGLKGKGCNLAVRINNKAYFVDGTTIDSHGDAHANDGFCNKIRKVKVQGEVVDNRFKASYFQLLPELTKKE